jgi:cbb3-type cytochrome oxidase subunit 3
MKMVLDALNSATLEFIGFLIPIALIVVIYIIFNPKQKETNGQ